MPATVFKLEVPWKAWQGNKVVVKRKSYIFGFRTAKEHSNECQEPLQREKSKSDLPQLVLFSIIKGFLYHLFASQINSHILYGFFSPLKPPPKQFDPGQWFYLSKYFLFHSHTSTCLCNIQTFESKQKCFYIFLSMQLWLHNI